MTEPMVIPIEARCLNCGYVARQGSRKSTTGEQLWAFGSASPVRLVRAASMAAVCEGCQTLSQFLFATEPVPGMGTPYPATERDEDSEYEYAREDAPLLQEDRR